MKSGPRRPWVAYDTNGDFVVFGEERLALRWAVERGWKVRQVEHGRSLLEQVKEPEPKEEK